MWKPGDKLVHPFNPELGMGVVHAVDGRYLRVVFPEADAELTLAAETGLERFVLTPGQRARVIETDEEVEIASLDDRTYTTRDGRKFPDAELWPLRPPDTPIERLAGARVDRLGSFRNRLDGLRLAELREAGGLGSFLGGRIELFPHQLHTALRAVEADEVRWLLADEVGLGKTVEACLILSALVRTGRAERALVVAPATLAVQWLGELYRKFHQVFVLLDLERIESVTTTVSEDANPFEVHPFGVMPLELLASDPELLRLASEAAPDLIVLDEAHRLATPEQHAALAPLVKQARHALLLTATPLQADREGFFRLLSLLHPDAFPSLEAFTAALDRGEAVIPCTSAVRRADVGGLPPRVPSPVDVEPPAVDPREDERTRWLVEQARGWARHGEKALVFVEDPGAFAALRSHLESATQTRVALFHEDMSVAKRDIEVAAFRETNLPLLLSSDAGSEGRNFQFCDRLVLWDLPLDPVVLEQRIGRLDRIGRDKPVEIVYFRHSEIEPDVARLYERLDLFARPSAGLDAALSGVAAALRAAIDAEAPLDVDALVASVDAAREGFGRDVARVFYRDGYDRSQDADLLARIPPELESLTARVCLGSANLLGFEVVDKGGTAMRYLELGASATVDSLPDVPGGSRFLGTFDRAEAVRRDEVDFFSNGHPLVEGLLLELEDGPRGRAACFELHVPGASGGALMALRRDGAGWAVELIDSDGSSRPEWVEPLLAALPDAKDLSRQMEAPPPETWSEAIRGLGAQLVHPDGLVAAAFVRFR